MQSDSRNQGAGAAARQYVFEREDGSSLESLDGSTLQLTGHISRLMSGLLTCQEIDDNSGRNARLLRRLSDLVERALSPFDALRIVSEPTKDAAGRWHDFNDEDGTLPPAIDVAAHATFWRIHSSSRVDLNELPDLHQFEKLGIFAGHPLGGSHTCALAALVCVKRSITALEDLIDLWRATATRAWPDMDVDAAARTAVGVARLNAIRSRLPDRVEEEDLVNRAEQWAKAGEDWLLHWDQRVAVAAESAVIATAAASNRTKAEASNRNKAAASLPRGDAALLTVDDVAAIAVALGVTEYAASVTAAVAVLFADRNKSRGQGARQLKTPSEKTVRRRFAEAKTKGSIP